MGSHMGGQQKTIRCGKISIDKTEISHMDLGKSDASDIRPELLICMNWRLIDCHGLESASISSAANPIPSPITTHTQRASVPMDAATDAGSSVAGVSLARAAAV